MYKNKRVENNHNFKRRFDVTAIYDILPEALAVENEGGFLGWKFNSADARQSDYSSYV